MLRIFALVPVATAYHVLYDKGAYVDRMQNSQRVHCLFGTLPPLDPVSRVEWHDKELDVVFLRISEAEAAAIGPCIISTPSKWPPDPPKEGEFVLMAGYPRA